MDRCSVSRAGEIVGEAVVGSGEYLAVISCHQRPIRLVQAEIKERNTVRCPADGRLWASASSKAASTGLRSGRRWPVEDAAGQLDDYPE
jgi:hypothetical protein